MNKKDVLTVIISFLAFIVAATTFYFNLLKRPKLSLMIGETIGLFYDPDYRLYFDMDIVIHNDGARHGVLVKLTGTISQKGSGESGLDKLATHKFKWYKFVEAKDVAEKGEPFTPRKVFAGWVMPVDVAGHEAIVRQITFRTEDECTLLALKNDGTEYEFTLEGRVYPQRRFSLRKRLPQCTRTLRMNFSDEELLKDYHDRDGMIRRILYMDFNEN